MPGIVVRSAAGVLLATVVLVVTWVGTSRRDEPGGGSGPDAESGAKGEIASSVVDLDVGGTVDGAAEAASRLRAHRTILSVADAQPMGDGWAVLDRRAARVHLLGPDLELRRSFGGRGEGPGEMRAPTELAPFADTLLAVLEESTLVLHLFTAEGDFVDRRPVALDGCRSGIQGDLAAMPDGGLAVVGRCSGAAGTRWIAADVDPAGTATILLERPVAEVGRIEPFLGIGLATVEGRTHLVQPDGCLLPLGADRPARPSGRGDRWEVVVRCLPAAPPVPIPDSVRRALEARLPARVADRYRLHLPEHLPRVLGVAWSPHGAVLELPTEGGALHTMILRPDGVVDRVTDARSIRPGRDRLLAWREEADGMVLRTIPWPAGEPPGARGR